MNSPVLSHIQKTCKSLRLDAYLIGGAVRDQLCGLSSHDWDFVAANAKQAARAVSRRLSGKVITLDESYRIYRIILKDGVTVDFAEIQGKTIEQDLSRRDFTINAMARRLSDFERIIDPFNGQKDLRKKVLKSISAKVFVEDPLRVLRAYRMMAQFGFSIERRTQKWIREHYQRLNTDKVARERIREEMLRLLSQPSCSKALMEMDRIGLLTLILPELEAGRRVGLAYYGRGGVMKHHLQSVQNLEWLLDHLGELRFIPANALPPISGYVEALIGGYPRRAYLKLAELLHDVGKPATAQVLKGRLRFFGHEDVGAQIASRMLNELRFSRSESGMVRSWIKNHMRAGSLASAPVLTAKALARYFYDLGEDAVGMILISLGDHYTYLAKKLWGKGKDSVERTAHSLLNGYYTRRESVLPPKIVDGHVLMKKLRIKPGPIVGKLLDAVREGQSEGLVKSVEQAIQWARKVLAKYAK